ncbi:MAG: PilZ domain-containing protein [Spirochaetales bacterium]
MSPEAQRFWQQIAEAYQPSALELTVFTLLLALLIGGLVSYTIHRSRRERRHQIELSERLFAETVSQRDLTPSQVDILRQMQQYLRDRTQIHQLVSDEFAFNAAASRLREESDISPQVIAALRVKLNFHADRTHRAPRSSAAIPEGATVLVARNRYRKPFRCRVLQPLPEAFRLEIVDTENRLPPGAGVDVFFQSSAGVFTFHTTVLSESEGIAELSHSEEVRRYQKRRFYRRKLHIPVRVELVDDGECVRSTLHEVGGGGASLLNPENKLRVGQDITLIFAPADEELRIKAHVVRLSDGGRTVHVNYEQIKEPLRDKIYHAIFQPPEDERDQTSRGRTGKSHDSNVTE